MTDISYQEAEAELADLLDKPAHTFVNESYSTFQDVLRDTVADLKNSRPGAFVGAWSYFNKATGGLREHEFTILCGPTGAGKTTLLANMGASLILSHTPVFVASVEIGANDFMKKVISIVSGKNTEDSDMITNEDIEEMKQAFGVNAKIRNSVFSNYDSRIAHRRLLADIYHAYKTKGTKVALLDNLNFMMDTAEDKNQVQQMDSAVHDFVVFCKKVPIHIIMVMHPRKTEGGRITSEFDIKGSSTAVQEASNVILFNRLEKPEDAPVGSFHNHCREIKFAKLRKRGKSVGARIILCISQQGEYMKEVRCF